MRERKNNTVGGHGGIVQVRQEGEKGTEIRVAWQKWSLYSKCSSVTKVSDPALCGAFHFPGARNRARAEGVCVLAHVCVIVCLRCPCDPSLDTHTHTRAGAHTLRLPLLARARRYPPFGAGSPKHQHSTLKTLKVCCEGAHA